MNIETSHLVLFHLQFVEYNLPSGANGSQTITIPASASTMSFAYVSGAWDSEVTYTITFNNGGADQVAISETNPGAGVKVLSVCP